jgi:hypothetical protein
MTTNYANTFVTVSPDCPVAISVVPGKPGSVAALQYALIADAPYTRTSDDVLFGTHAARNAIAEADLAAERERFFAKPKACLRASPLVKQFGWGVHHDADGRVAIYGVESARYQELAADAGLRVVAGMRSKRG